jgi:transmembrane sensor
MSGNKPQVRDLIGQEAADWFVANRANLSATERHNFATWLKTSPVHVEEYLLISGIARDLHAACENPDCPLESLLARARLEDGPPLDSPWARIVTGIREFPSPRWQTAAVAMAALAVASFGLLALWNLKPAPHVPAAATSVLHFETRHGEQQTQRLADGSVLHLNTESSATIRYGKTERLVMLNSGEAAFEVAHAPDRPFRVFAGAAEVVDVGTRFDVRLVDESTVVTVLEGLVAVAPSNQSHPAQFVQLGANQQISVSEEGVWPATAVPVDSQRSTAWLHRQITFEHEPLQRVVVEFNRYAAKPIEITTPALRNLEISGVFSIEDTDAFIAFLRSLEGVHVTVTDRQIRVSQN